MPVNVSRYDISDFDSNHCGDSITTLEMPTHYSMKEPNTDHRQGRPERGQVLQFLEEVQFCNMQGKGRLTTREATTSCHPNTSYSKFMALFLGSQYFSEPSSSSTGFRASLKWGGAAGLLIVRSALG